MKRRRLQASLIPPEPWYPPPQSRAILPALPGRGCGLLGSGASLWFEGLSRIRQSASREEAEKVADEAYWARVKIRNLPVRNRARDVRHGDRWLPWHHIEE